MVAVAVFWKVVACASGKPRAIAAAARAARERSVVILGGPVRYSNEKEKWIYSPSEKYLSR
jgi:hypothetical protein